MASKQPRESQHLSSICRAENLYRQVDEFRTDLNKAIKNATEKIIRENACFITTFEHGSSSKDVIMKSLMDFAVEASNIEEFADMIGDVTTKLTDLKTLGSTISNILESQQFEKFVWNLLDKFRENLENWSEDERKFKAERLILEISQTIADYVADLTVDFVWDRVMNDENDDEDEDK